MAISLGDAVVTFRADLTDLNKSIGDATRQMKRDFGSMMDLSKQVGTAFTFIGGAAVAGFGLAVKAAADSEDAQAQLNAVLTSTQGVAGMTADACQQLADGLSKVSTFDDEAILGGESLLLTFTNIGKDAFPLATQTMLDMSQAMGQDLKSSAIQLGKALNDPTQGLTALTRVGVTFTEQQKQQIQALQESGNLFGAQKIMLDELSREFGGSAAAAAQTFSGQLMQLKNDFDNLMEDIGNALTDGGGIKGLIGQVREAVAATRDWIQQHPILSGWIIKIAAGLGGIMFVLGPILIALPGLATAITGVSTAFAALNIAMLPEIALFAGIGIAIGALIYISWKLYENWDTIKAKLAEIWESLKEKAANALQRLGETVRSAVDAVAWAFTHPIDAIKGAWNGLMDFFGSIWEGIKGFFKAGWDFIADIMQKIAAGVAWVWDQISLGYNGGAPSQPPAMAEGGIARGGITLVGERGPELVNLPGGARVYPADQTREMLSGGGGNVNLGGVHIAVSGVNDPEAIAEKVSKAIERRLQNTFAKRGMRLATV